jgi:hypothetical protein
VLAAQGDGPIGLAFGTSDAESCRKMLAERGLEPEPVQRGLGRDVESGAIREWLNVMIPLARTRGVVLFAIEHRSPAELPAASAAGPRTLRSRASTMR